MNDADGSVVLVTGSAVGIGSAICTSFAARGARIVGLDTDAANNALTARAVAEQGAQVRMFTCDVGDPNAVEAAVRQVVEEWGRIDVLVNNAALWNDTRLTAGDYTTQVRAFHQAMDSCVTGSFHCAAAVVPAMAPGGNIVNLLTNHIRADQLITGLPATGYDAAKFAQWRLTEHWAVELAPMGIRVNGLAFGATDTPMLRAVSDKYADAGMRADDVARAVINVVGQGPQGDNGIVHDFGFTGAPLAEARAVIERLAYASTAAGSPLHR